MSKEIQKKEEVNGVEPLVKYVDNLSGKPVHNPRCKLCNSEFRNEAEELWDRMGNLTAVHKMLTSKGEDIHKSSVRNHLMNHFAQPFREERLKEYTEDVKAWSEMEQSKEERLASYLVLIDRQIHKLNSMTDESSTDAMRKTSDIVVKLMEEAAKIEDRLEKHRQRMEPIQIFVQKFRDTMMVHLEKMDSEDGRVALVEILDTVEKEASEIIVNG